MAFQDFDQIQERVNEHRRQKYKKRITIAIVSFVSVMLLVGGGVGAFLYVKKKPSSSSSSGAQITTSQRDIRTICAGTDHQKICEDSLTKAVANNPNPEPEDILKASFTVVSDAVENAVKAIGDMKPDEFKLAHEGCLRFLSYAVEDVNASISSIQGPKLDMSVISDKKPDLNNWLSTVLGYTEACIDSFPEGEVQNKLKEVLKEAKQLGSNALAIVAEAASMISKFQGKEPENNKKANRRLLEFPEWMGEEERRFLEENVKDVKPHVTVAKDGSGNFKTITEALNAMPKPHQGRYVIYVKEGIYEENVNVTRAMPSVTMYGDGPDKTIVTGNKHVYDKTVPVFLTATFAAEGHGFRARSMCFRNTAGPEKEQAVALRVMGNEAIFVDCKMEGNQDTLLADQGRQFYRSCQISGTVDFIFGYATALFQNCMIHLRRPRDGQKDVVVANGRSDRRDTTGFVIHNSHILADDQMEKEKAKFPSYLGRPWKEFSRVTVLETQIGDVIHSQGWMEYRPGFALSTLEFLEYGNKGPGANTAGRVKWPGWKEVDKNRAMQFTVGPFLDGEAWLKNVDDIHVPLRFGLTA